ncbi:MAG: ABC transporter permease [Eubacteriales bacterium]|nr:ABC transporter permease [Eubacteriales bacterium]
MIKQQFFTVMGFEFMTFMRNKVYIGITIFIVILLALGLSAPRLVDTAKDLGFGGDPAADDPSRTIYVLNQSGYEDLYGALTAGLPEERWSAGEPEQREAYLDRVAEKEALAVLEIESDASLVWTEYRINNSGLAAMASQILTRQLQSMALSEQGLSETAIQQILTPPAMTTHELVEEMGKSMEQTYFYTYLLLFLLYMTVMMYGQLVASSVASEKSNRSMEMLITSARPLSLMFGKVIGSGLAGLAQIAVFLVSAAGFYALNQDSWADIPFIRSIFDMPPHIIVYTIFFYLAGYFMYAFLYGALGSLASRIEDINTSIMPIMLIIMAAMFVSIFGMISPEAGWLAVFSFVPFFSPMAMFVRIAMTQVPGWQIAVSIVIMLATIWLTGWVSSRIYRIGVLMYGKPPKLNEVIRILRQTQN